MSQLYYIYFIICRRKRRVLLDEDEWTRIFRILFFEIKLKIYVKIRFSHSKYKG